MDPRAIKRRCREKGSLLCSERFRNKTRYRPRIGSCGKSHRRRDARYNAASMVSGVLRISPDRRFFDNQQPQIGFLDPVLHTLPYIRSHSALLTTVILATSALTMPDSAMRAVADRLYGHAERLLLIVHSCNAKSVEIVQVEPCLSASLMPRRFLYSLFGLDAQSDLPTTSPECELFPADKPDIRWLSIALHSATELGLYRFHRCSSSTDESLILR